MVMKPRIIKKKKARKLKLRGIGPHMSGPGGRSRRGRSGASLAEPSAGDGYPSTGPAGTPVTKKEAKAKKDKEKKTPKHGSKKRWKTDLTTTTTTTTSTSTTSTTTTVSGSWVSKFDNGSFELAYAGFGAAGSWTGTAWQSTMVDTNVPMITLKSPVSFIWDNYRPTHVRVTLSGADGDQIAIMKVYDETTSDGTWDGSDSIAASEPYDSLDEVSITFVEPNDIYHMCFRGSAGDSQFEVTDVEWFILD